MKKYMFLALLFILTGCGITLSESSDLEIITVEASAEQISVEELVFESDLIVKVRAVEELSAANSVVVKSEDGTIEDFYNIRNYEVIEVLSGDFNQDQIMVKESVAFNEDNNQVLEVYEGSYLKTMKKDNEYLLYLEKDEDEYTIGASGLARADYSEQVLNESLSSNVELLEVISREGSLVQSSDVVKMTEYESVKIGSDTVNYFEMDDNNLYLEINGKPYIAERG